MLNVITIFTRKNTESNNFGMLSCCDFCREVLYLFSYYVFMLN